MAAIPSSLITATRLGTGSPLQLAREDYTPQWHFKATQPEPSCSWRAQ